MEQSYVPALPRPSQSQSQGEQLEKHMSKPPPALPSPPQYDLHAKFLDGLRPSELPPIPSRLEKLPPIHSHIAHDPASLSLPGVPTTELPPIQPHHEKSASGSNHTLPSLSSVTTALQPSPEPRPPAPTHWPSLNPFTAFYSPGYAQPADSLSRADVASPERYSERRSGSVSLDDPDVRMAAEALGDLRADFVSSPPNRSTPLPGTPRDIRMATASPRESSGDRQRPEPLLSLITASHPLLATTIEGATSAYNSGKNLNPHLKTGAEYIEDYLTPVAKTVGTIGRKTGVEGGVRWIFGGGRKHGRKHQSPSDLEAGGDPKRRRAKLSAKEKEAFDRSFPETVGYADRRMSVSTIETLPAYDDHRSPAYTEANDAASRNPTRPGSSSSSEWKTRIVVSTSGLGVAMQDQSLRSLKYCLAQVRVANTRVSSMLSNLQRTIEQYDAAKSGNAGGDHVMTDASGPAPNDEKALLARIDALKNDIAKSLFDVIKLVSRYAGGALPDNVRNIVYEQFTGLPHRWHALMMRDASSEPGATEPGASAAANKDTVIQDCARRALLLAKEGLDMLNTVSDVIDRTIKSAEEWCQVLGKGAKEGETETSVPEKGPSPAQWAVPQPHPAAPADQDVHMTG